MPGGLRDNSALGGASFGPELSANISTSSDISVSDLSPDTFDSRSSA